MSTHTQEALTTHHVAEWPRIVAHVDENGRGAITINGTSRACAAESVAALRAGVIARCVAIANSLHRPVRLDVTEAGQTHALGVRPEGYVQLVDSSGVIAAVAGDGLTVDEGRCRVCRRLQPVTSSTCVQCTVDEPLRVEVDPNENSGPVLWADVLYPSIEEDAEPINESSDPTGVDEHAEIRRRGSFYVDPINDLEQTRLTQRAALSPALILRIDGREPVTVSGSVAIGRRPVAVDGREPVTVDSLSRQVSRTHATIDVDDAGRIIVTDLHSANGVEIDGADLVPGQPSVVPNGATLLLGDTSVIVHAG